MTLLRRRFRGLATLVALVTAVALIVTAAPAMAATSTVTQADCDAGRIKNKEGATLSRKDCEALIGKRVQLAQTGFEAWWLLLGGVACIGGAVALRVRPRPSPQV